MTLSGCARAYHVDNIHIVPYNTCTISVVHGVSVRNKRSPNRSEQNWFFTIPKIVRKNNCVHDTLDKALVNS